MIVSYPRRQASHKPSPIAGSAIAQFAAAGRRACLRQFSGARECETLQIVSYVRRARRYPSSGAARPGRRSLRAHRGHEGTRRDSSRQSFQAVCIRHVRIGTERDQFLAAVPPVFEAPQSPAGRCHEQERVASVEGLVSGIAGPGVANSYVAERCHITPAYPNEPDRTPSSTYRPTAAPLDAVRQGCTRKA